MSGALGRVPGDDGLDGAVARLAVGARQRNLARTDRVLELLGSVASAGTAERDEAARLCHSIAGSAGTFGDDELADGARHLGAALSDGHADRISAALERMRVTASVLRPR